jgi:serine/threonine-protein kinase
VCDDLLGATFGHCVIRSVLGQGGMACVYRGYQMNLDRDVAIKVLPAQYAADKDFVERFKSEARAMARLSHPNIVTVHDAGQERGRLYIVMAYIPNGTLKDRMGKPLDPRDVARCVKEVASALAYAHERGIVHRDVKPANVLIDADGRAILSDFGIAKVLASSSGLTRHGAGVGTPEYMSPEQCRGDYVDTRADIYALGVLIYEMLTGHTPFEADNYTALAHAHIYEPVPPPSRLNPRISPAVQAVILKALAKAPSDRFQTATDLALALDQAVAAQAPVAPGAAPPGRITAAPLGSQETPGYAEGYAPGYGAPGYGAPGYGAPSVRSQPPIYCLTCHQPNSPAQRFCSWCGVPLAVNPPTPSTKSGLSGMLSSNGAVLRCPRCQAINRSFHHFCTTCGMSLTGAPLVCANCGSHTVPGQRFCTTCGKPLE